MVARRGATAENRLARASWWPTDPLRDVGGLNGPQSHRIPTRLPALRPGQTIAIARRVAHARTSLGDRARAGALRLLPSPLAGAGRTVRAGENRGPGS